MVRTGLYTRISRAEDQERGGVERQEADLRREAERRGWEVARVYEDNDLSGSGKVFRPNYEAMVKAIREGQLDAVLAWDVDRLQRGLQEFVSFYEACAQRQARVGWMGGDADFGTGRGLFELELKGTFAREELRKIKQRVRRKHQELAEKGMLGGKVRSFGYRAAPEGDPRRVVVVEEEAVIVRELARRVLSGESLASICGDLNRREAKTIRGGPWNVHGISYLLKSGRISGRRDHGLDQNGHRLSLARIVSDATWDAIITVEQSDQLRRLLGDSKRRSVPRAGVSEYL
ncbi:MAG TPA: recombinase family protein, partial [Candidatus Dormibacteraeota bacterium]|nr:recombinase family protein [Candidatus Dormibacteraeota bacterium]